MQSSLKKSLYLGLAALSFAGVAAVSTTANAKSYATAGAYTTLKADATTRNVEATGSNALYTKPGTVKGAKVVASKATMKTLATSKKSANYFRAYGQKVTNRGSVYYRVVTMDGKYRGYVYGGKTEGTFAGGIKSATTTTTQTNPTKLQSYYLKDVSKNTLWTAPKYTQYKASKVSLYGAQKDDPFVVDQAATKTREGSLYYHVTDLNDKSISGWIYAGKGYDANATATNQSLGGLSLTLSEASATADNSVNVVYRDASGATVGNATWITTTKNTKANDAVTLDTDKNVANTLLPAFVSQNAPAGYTVTSGAVTAATYGQTVYATVAKAATSKVALKVNSVNNNVDGATTATTVAPVLKVGASLTTTDLTVNPTDLKVLTGETGTALTKAQLNAITSSLGVAKIDGNQNYTDANGDYYHYQFTLNTSDFNSDNRNAQFGDTLTASYDAQLVSGKADTANSSDTSWMA